jgi:hypothetical protein
VAAVARSDPIGLSVVSRLCAEAAFGTGARKCRRAAYLENRSSGIKLMTTTTVSKMFQADHRKRHGWFWYVSTCNDRPLQRTRFDSAADSDRHCSRQQRNTNRWWPSGMGAFAGTGEAEPSSEARTCDRQHAAGWTGDGGLNPKLDAEESQDHRVGRLQAAPQQVVEVIVPVERTLAG